MTVKTRSYWIESAPLPRFRQPGKDITVDTVIIGGGIMGVTTAFLLKQAGQTVALLERARMAQIDTGHTTAHITPVTDRRLSQIARTFGRDAAKVVWDAGAAAQDQIAHLVRTEGLDCDFRWVPGYLHAPVKGREGKHTTQLQNEARLAASLGIRAEFVSSVPFFGVPGIKFAHQSLFHPRKYLGGLIRRIPGRGSHVFEHTEAIGVKERPMAVKTGGNSIRCRYVVLATHNPLMGKTGLMAATLFQTKLALYTSYAIGAKIPRDLVPAGAFWDTGNPYDYVRVEPRRGYDYAIYGGEDHKTGQEDDTAAAFHRLETRFLRQFPRAKIDHCWSGQVIETNDGLPYIGETAKNQFTATGFAGNGMTFGTLAAMMAVDAIEKRKNPWQDLFDVHRAKVRGGTWRYLIENKDYPYYMVRDWMAGAEGKTLDAVKRTEGRILNLAGKKVAAFRDQQGKVTLCSPVCPHLKCIVHWNRAERTWDCPCHGSRFKPTGEVISGPAEESLERLPTPK